MTTRASLQLVMCISTVCGNLRQDATAMQQLLAASQQVLKLKSVVALHAKTH